MDYFHKEKPARLYLTALFMLCTVVNIIDTKSVGLPGANINSIEGQVSYFKQYGYLQGSFDLSKFKKGYSKEDKLLFEGAVREFQDMMGLPVTGVLDKDSLNIMSMPRCGLPDKPLHGNTRHKRYDTFGGLRLVNNNISFGVEPNSYSNHLPKERTRHILRRALKMWSDNANLHFYEVTTTRPVIEFKFARLHHNDDFDFDGPGRILAHAFPPIASNFYSHYLADVHLDEDENWTDNSYSGKNAFQVVTHELGHSLGLNHTSVNSAVMAPVYKGYDPYFRMHPDDIQGIQYLYGAPKVTSAQPAPKTPEKQQPPIERPPPPNDGSRTPTRGPQPPIERPQPPIERPQPPIERPQPPIERPEKPDPPQKTNPDRCAYDFCGCAEVKAITTTQNSNSIYAFYDKYVYQLDLSQGIKEGFPKYTGQVFPRFYGNVDAALSWPKSPYRAGAESTRLFLFQGYAVFEYSVADNGTITYRDRKAIGSRFPGLTGPVNVSIVWSGNQMTYFIQGDQYYRLTTNGDGKVHPSYPKPVSAWKFPENKIPDGGFQYYNTYTYFFFGRQYYRYNDRLVEVQKQSYPRDTAAWWFGCNSAANLVVEGHSPRWRHEPLNKLDVEMDSDYEANNANMVSKNVIFHLLVVFSIMFVNHLM